MKKLFFLLALILLCSQITSAKVIFVKQNANGDGSSWTSAFGQLQSALTIAESGDQIWVASGTYYTSYSKDVSVETRGVSFVIKDGVELYGGFSGNEITLKDRDIKFNKTILSGEIGDAASIKDNAFTILTTIDVSAKTIIDGFTFTGGNANGYGTPGDAACSGGALFNKANINTESSPTISNCTFINNRARSGGAIFNFANEGKIRSMLTNCSFIANISNFNGGALYNHGDYGVCNPIIKNCLFTENDGYYGSAILNKGLEGETKPLIIACIFTNNISTVRGGAVYSFQEEKGICKEIYSNGCRFESNRNRSSIQDGKNDTLASNEHTVGIKVRASNTEATPADDDIPSFDD